MPSVNTKKCKGGIMPRLTEQEQQEIVRYIEGDKPLPDKYRFLLFDDKREVELVWNGKTGDVFNGVLPFQVIEHIDEPRAETPEEPDEQLVMFDDRGRQRKGWANKLIWGDNKFILSSLKNGATREEIEAEGGIKLIYIDPPFDVGADFKMKLHVPPSCQPDDSGDFGDELDDDKQNHSLTKEPNILEELAYRDTWGNGADSFIAMIYERLVLMRDLLADDGSIYVHCDWRVSGYIRLVLDEVFGRDNFRNKIVWFYPRGGDADKQFNRKHDSIYWYSKQGERWIFNRDAVSIPYTPEQISRFKEKDDKGRFYWNVNPRGERVKTYLGKAGIGEYDVWNIGINASELKSIGYPTAKPPRLVERIIKASSSKGDLVADFFCGSGTMAVVAEKLGRKWIATDLGKFAIHTTRKRLISVQRGLKAAGKDYRAFEVLNLGKYERQQYIGINPNLRGTQQQEQLKRKGKEYTALILRAYSATAIKGSSVFQGQRAGRFVAVGPINLPVTRSFVEAVIKECLHKEITRVDILAFEYEMGLFPNMLEEARNNGIDIEPKCIPADVFDKRAVECGAVKFHDVAYINVRLHYSEPSSVQVELTNYAVSYSQGSIREAEQTLRNNGVMNVVENGRVIQIRKDAQGVCTQNTVTRHWTQWIDYWSVDFDFESKREIIRTQAPEIREPVEEWTGDYIFENEWQSFRTHGSHALELTSVVHKCCPGRRKVAVKVVDIFGNDTMKVIPANVPSN